MGHFFHAPRGVLRGLQLIELLHCSQVEIGAGAVGGQFLERDVDHEDGIVQRAAVVAVREMRGYLLFVLGIQLVAHVSFKIILQMAAIHKSMGGGLTPHSSVILPANHVLHSSLVTFQFTPGEAELAARFIEARTDGSDGNVQNLRDFLVRQVVHLA